MNSLLSEPSAGTAGEAGITWLLSDHMASFQVGSHPPSDDTGLCYMMAENSERAKNQSPKVS